MELDVVTKSGHTVQEFITAYFNNPQTLSRAAEEVGVSPREFVSVLINELFGVPGDSDVLDYDEDAHNYGRAYELHELAEIPRMIILGKSLLEIARELGRTVLGIGWKALGIPEVTRWLKERYERSTTPTEFLIRRFLSPLDVFKRNSRYALGLAHLHVVFDILWSKIKQLEPTEISASHAEIWANQVLDDQPLPRITLWLRVEKKAARVTADFQIIEGQSFLRSLVDVFALEHLFASEAELELAPPSRKAMVTYDIVNEKFTVSKTSTSVEDSEQPASSHGVMVGVERMVGRKLSSLHPALREQILHVAYAESGHYDQKFEKAAVEATQKLEKLLGIKIPVNIVIGGNQESAHTLFSSDKAI